MKKTALNIFMLLFFTILLSSCDSSAYDDGFDKGYLIGYDEGYTYGYDEGLERGYNNGQDYGYNNGYDEGFNDGFNEGEMYAKEDLKEYEDLFDEGYVTGYNDGEVEGYQSGEIYTCLFFGDINRAFQAANKGSSWVAFVDAYNEYITPIYHDNETRYALHSALSSISVSNDISTEQKELLIDTFGLKLFTDNGIKFK